MHHIIIKVLQITERRCFKVPTHYFVHSQHQGRWRPCRTTHVHRSHRTQYYIYECTAENRHKGPLLHRSGGGIMRLMGYRRTPYHHSTSDPEATRVNILYPTQSNRPMANTRICGHKARVIIHMNKKKDYCNAVIIRNPRHRGQVTMSAKLPPVRWEPRCEPDGCKTAQGHCVEHTIPAHDVILQREGEE